MELLLLIKVFKEYKQVHARAYLKNRLIVSVMEACSLFLVQIPLFHYYLLSEHQQVSPGSFLHFLPSRHPSIARLSRLLPFPSQTRQERSLLCRIAYCDTTFTEARDGGGTFFESYSGHIAFLNFQWGHLQPSKSVFPNMLCCRRYLLNCPEFQDHR